MIKKIRNICGTWSPVLLSVLLVAGLLVSACGYQLVKEKGIYGGDIKTVYVPVFKNATFEPHASLYVTDAFAKEMLSTGLFKISRENADGYVEGTIKEIKITPNVLNKDGLVIEKKLDINIEVALFLKNGSVVKRWYFSDSEPYRTEDINLEDYNKREALKTTSGRMARRFCSVILVEY